MPVVGGQIADQSPHLAQGKDIVGHGEMGHAALLGMHPGSAQILGGDVLVGDGLDHARAGDEHVRGVLDHEDEIGDRGAVDRTAGAGSHDAGDLGHDAAGPDIAVKDLAVGGQGIHALLDARPARIVEADDRGAHLDRQIHDLADLLGMGLAERTAEHGEILTEDKHLATVDGAVTGDDAVAKISFLLAQTTAPADFEDIELFKGTIVQQQIEPLPRGQLALLVLIGLFRFPTGGNRLRPQSFKGLKGRIILSIHCLHLVTDTSPWHETHQRTGSQFFISQPQLRCTSQPPFLHPEG